MYEILPHHELFKEFFSYKELYKDSIDIFAQQKREKQIYAKIANRMNEKYAELNLTGNVCRDLWHKRIDTYVNSPAYWSKLADEGWLPYFPDVNQISLRRRHHYNRVIRMLNGFNEPSVMIHLLTLIMFILSYFSILYGNYFQSGQVNSAIYGFLPFVVIWTLSIFAVDKCNESYKKNIPVVGTFRNYLPNWIPFVVLVSSNILVEYLRYPAEFSYTTGSDVVFSFICIVTSTFTVFLHFKEAVASYMFLLIVQFTDCSTVFLMFPGFILANGCIMNAFYTLPWQNPDSLNFWMYNASRKQGSIAKIHRENEPQQYDALYRPVFRGCTHVFTVDEEF